jgi:hypothetical protein
MMSALLSGYIQTEKNETIDQLETELTMQLDYY